MSVLERVTDEIFTIPNLFSAQECAEWIALGESLGYEPALVNDVGGQQRHEDIRNNSRVVFDDEGRADALWQRIAQEVPAIVAGWHPVGLNERMRFYRYDIGERFKWHGDGSVRRSKCEQSMLTFMVYLNHDFSGGETAFHEALIQPEEGKALLFCHWLKHRGNEVREGRKYVLRSDIMFKKNNA